MNKFYNNEPGGVICVNNAEDFKAIEPDWKLAFQLLYGFCLGSGLEKKIQECEEIQRIIQPKWLVPRWKEKI